MRSVLRNLFIEWLQLPPKVVAAPPSPHGRGAGGEGAMCVPYDETLLERVGRTTGCADEGGTSAEPPMMRFVPQRIL